MDKLYSATGRKIEPLADTDNPPTVRDGDVSSLPHEDSKISIEELLGIVNELYYTAFSVHSIAELQLNPIDLANTDAINALVDTAVQSGFWTSKQGVQGILEHEFGHALEEYGVDPLSKDINAKIDRYMAVQKYGRHEIAERELTNAFANSKITLTEDNLRKYISEYAKKGYHDYGTYAETFAEAVSDNKPNRITGYIQNIIRSW